MSPSELEDKVNELVIRVDALQAELRQTVSACRIRHTELDRKVESTEEELDEHDAALDALKLQLNEHGKVLHQVQHWVERWGMETTHIGAALEKLDERQGQTSRVVATVLEKLGEVMNTVNVIAADVRRPPNG